MTETHLDKVCARRRTKITEQIPIEVSVPSPGPFEITDSLCIQIKEMRSERDIPEEPHTRARAWSVEVDRIAYLSHA